MYNIDDPWLSDVAATHVSAQQAACDGQCQMLWGFCGAHVLRACASSDTFAVCTQNVCDEFVCALRKRILLQGRLYICEHYICFYSHLFGYNKEKVIPLKVRVSTASVILVHADRMSPGMRILQLFLSCMNKQKLALRGLSLG